MKKNVIKYLLVVTTLSCMLCGCGNTGSKTQTFGNSQSEAETDENEEDSEEEKKSEEDEKSDDEKKSEEDEKSDDKEKSEENQESDEKPEDDSDGKKSDDNQTAAGNYEVALDGILFTIPRTFSVTVTDETEGVYINDEDYNFEMVLVVRDGSYTESLKDKESLMENAQKKGYTITKEIRECEINDKSYAYFTYESEDYDVVNTVAYTEGAGDKRIGMNIIINSDMTQEEVLEIIDTFLHDTEKTGKPDTTLEDLMEANHVSDGIALEETKLKLGDKTYTAKVPSGYYYMDEYSSDDSYTQMFESENQQINVSIRIMELPYYGTPKEYVKDEFEMVDENDSDYSQVERSEIEETKVNGNTVYYGSMTYLYKGKVYKDLFAACELPDGESYILDVNTLYEEENLSFDMFQDFMDIK